MALVKYGGGIIQMSGSIAGSVHARNHYGNYVRARTKPVNPQTARQTSIRAIFAQLTQRWATVLTAVQREAWNLYGSSVAMKNHLGEVVYMTGYNHYLRSNTVVLQIGEAPIDAAPTVFNIPEQDPTFAIAADGTTQTISYTFDNTLAWAIAIGGFLVKYMGQPQNPQRNFFNGPWRFHGIITGAVTPPTTPDPETDPPFVFMDDQKIWCYGRILLVDGRLSEPFRAECIAETVV